MRWLVIRPGPSFSVADVCDGWTEALRELGETVFEYSTDDRLAFYEQALLPAGESLDGLVPVRKALTRDQAVGLAVNGLLSTCYQRWPDVILVVSGFFTPPELLDLLRSRGHLVVIVFTESPYQDDRQVALAEHGDLVLLNDPTNLERFRQITTAEYMPHAYRPSVHKPGGADPDLLCDLSFVGTGYPSRVAFLEQMDLAGLRVTLAGNWQSVAQDSPLRSWVSTGPDECLDNAEAVRLYRASRCGINLYRREADRAELSAGWAIGPREVEMAACQTFFLRDPREEGDALLWMLPTFGSPQDATEKLRWFLAHPGERAKAARKARAALAGRTFTRNAARLLRLIERQPGRV